MHFKVIVSFYNITETLRKINIALKKCNEREQKLAINERNHPNNK